MLSLVLALIVTPVFYVLLDQWTSFLRRIGVRFAVERQPPAAISAPAKVPARELIESA